MISNIKQKFKLVKGYHKEQNYLNALSKYNARLKLPLSRDVGESTFEDAEKMIHLNRRKKSFCKQGSNVMYYENKKRKMSDVIEKEWKEQKEGMMRRIGNGDREKDKEAMARIYMDGLMKRKRGCSVNLRKNITMPANTLENMIEVREARLFGLGCGK